MWVIFLSTHRKSSCKNGLVNWVSPLPQSVSFATDLRASRAASLSLKSPTMKKRTARSPALTVKTLVAGTWLSTKLVRRPSARAVAAGAEEEEEVTAAGAEAIEVVVVVVAAAVAEIAAAATVAIAATAGNALLLNLYSSVLCSGPSIHLPGPQFPVANFLLS